MDDIHDEKVAIERAAQIVSLENALIEEKCRGTIIGFTGKTLSVSFQNLKVYPYDNDLAASGRLTKLVLWAGRLLKRNPTLETTTSADSLPRLPKCILKGLDGAAFPGEMVLVLGRPGSGCTTFLKTIANRTKDYKSVTGSLLYGGIQRQQWSKEFPAESVFCGASDQHIPSLTVEQTLRFALDLTNPKATPVFNSPAAVKTQILDSLLRLLNIDHTRNTMVGDARIRGISGGERKRISLAEAMMCRAAITCWDNPTLGLDASSAADFVASLRTLTRVYESIAFVSLYQASDTLTNCFDKVLLLEDGHELFYGNLESALQHFQDLGFVRDQAQSKADFLMDCIDPRHRKTPGQISTEILLHSFRTSKQYASILAEFPTSVWSKGDDCYMDFQSKVVNDKTKGFRGTTKHFSPFGKQLIVLARRHLLLKAQDWPSLLIKNATSLIIALVCGSVYWQLPQSSDGAFTRGGIIFISLLYIAFTAFAELPATLQGRSVLYKHTSFALFRPSALYLGQIIVDQLVSVIENLIFSVVVYFMSGLGRSASAFFIFFLFITLAQTCMTLFFRTLGCINKNLDTALRWACVAVVMFVLCSGYLVPYSDQRPWIKWFYWINPIAYAFSGNMINEFKRINMACRARDFIPAGESYSGTEGRICNMPGATTGSVTVSGAAYIYKAFGYETSHLWRNFGIMIIFAIGFLCFNITTGEFLSFAQSDSNVRIFKAQRRRTQHDEEATDSPMAPMRITFYKSQVPVTWHNLNYTVPYKGGQKQLLHDITGCVEPGRLMALMGASGAGKSTLLDVLSKRKSIGVVTGEILLGGQKPASESRFRQGTAYCEQLDVHDPFQTVREALQFSARLRQPESVPVQEKDAYVEDLIVLLEMSDFADSLIGDPQLGLSVEERKRVTIGVELAAKPDILLFLDEPTSGLDSQSALSIARFLRKLADAGQAIICTIHQPNSAIFHLFDDLLLLHHGRTMFCGPTRRLAPYFEEAGYPCEEGVNITEHMLRVLMHNRESLDAEAWETKWRASSDCAEMQSRVATLEEGASASSTETQSLKATSQTTYQTSFLTMVKIVCTRWWISVWRMPGYGSTRVFNHVTIALLTGLAYLNIGNSFVDLQYRIFVIFQATILPSLILSQVEPRYEMARNIFAREESSRMYSKSVFVLSMVVSELPYNIVCSVVFFVLLFYPANFSHNSSQAGYQFFIIFLTENFSSALGLATAAMTPSAYAASHLTPFFLIIFSLFCGVTVPSPNIPHFWKWMYRLNPLTYMVGGMISTEFHDLKVVCKESELRIFQPADHETCWEYSRAWLSTANVGYLSNPNATLDCGYCPASSGEEYVAQFGLFWSNRWRDLGIYSVYLISTLIILWIAATKLNWNRR